MGESLRQILVGLPFIGHLTQRGTLTEQCYNCGFSGSQAAAREWMLQVAREENLQNTEIHPSKSELKRARGGICVGGVRGRKIEQRAEHRLTRKLVRNATLASAFQPPETISDSTILSRAWSCCCMMTGVSHLQHASCVRIPVYRTPVV